MQGTRRYSSFSTNAFQQPFVQREPPYAGTLALLPEGVFGRSIDPAKNALSIIIREPVGVVGVISPWNWPIQLMFREMVPALAAGNAIVLTPASLTAAISMEVIELLSEISAFAKGIMNAVSGPGQLAGEALAASPHVNMISFTGDTNTGERVAALAAKTMKKVTLEPGGKSPNFRPFTVLRRRCVRWPVAPVPVCAAWAGGVRTRQWPLSIPVRRSPRLTERRSVPR